MGGGTGTGGMATERYPSSRLTCAYCGVAKYRFDGFPSATSAECWECAWKHHNEQFHGPRRGFWNWITGNWRP